MTEANVQSWLEGDYDEETKRQIREMTPEQLQDAFYKRLEFGTGGLRGIMGVGTNRLNIYTVRAATQGLANYLKKEGKQPLRVLVGYDSRNNSKLFAEEAARVLGANGIEVLLLEELRPVPLISFGCRHKECSAAVLITASHNPPEYNGYKVYWSNGGQVLPPHDVGIIEEVNKITSPDQVKLGPLEPIWIGDEVDQAYFETTRNLQSYPSQNAKRGAELKVVYSSLHGAGITLVPKSLEGWGFTNLQLVEKQCIPDGDFPTLTSPNPEEPEAMEMGTQQMMAQEADLFIATDPDTDRLGVVVRHDGEAVRLNGNETACLCLHHLCRKAKGTNLAAVKTIVTTELFAAIAKHYGVACFDVLTGFKYIGELMDQWETSGEHEYLFGAEESYGSLLGTHARDKDAVIASSLVCELALDAKLAGETLIDRLESIYKEFGLYREKLISLTFKGKDGAERMSQLMEQLRTKPPEEIAGVAVTEVQDLLPGGPLPPSNVLLFHLEDGTKLVVRPSGTEPKIKLYAGVVDEEPAQIEEAIAACDQKLDKFLNELSKQLQD
jgi:phosphomannomutase